MAHDFPSFNSLRDHLRTYADTVHRITLTENLPALHEKYHFSQTII
jgi:hypothetical protein